MTKVDKLTSLEQNIKNLREKMHELIEAKENLINPDVIEISQMLDEVLTQYYGAQNKYSSLLKEK